MESLDWKVLELVKKEPEHSKEILSATAPSCLTSIENKCVSDVEMQLKKDNGNQENCYVIQWSEQNNNENCNVVHQVVLGNCSEQNVERYADFVINGHFLTDLLPKESSAVTSMFEECPTCHKKLKPESFKRHCYYCKKLIDLQCNYCSFKTKNKKDLSNHTISKHIGKNKYEPENDADLMCSTCEKKLDSKESLEIQKHFCKNPQYFHCNSCDYHTNSRSNLIRHTRTLHCSDQSVVCPTCGKRLKNRNSLSVHKSYCGKEPHLHCDICSYKTKYKRDFILHSAKIHLKNAESIKMSNAFLKNIQDSTIAKLIDNTKGKYLTA